MSETRKRWLIYFAGIVTGQLWSLAIVALAGAS